MRSRIVWGILLATAVSLSGCTSAEPSVRSPAVSAEVTASVTATVPAPALPHVEYRLPGSCLLRAYTDAHALLTRAEGAQGSTRLLLLDLATGHTRSLLDTPVAAARGLVFGGSTLSDEVVAWEEVSPRDADAPDETVWRLYACRYDASSGLLGAPVLVDGSERGARSRPLFGVDGFAVVFLTNERDSDGRWTGRVQRLDVATSERTVVLEGGPFDTLSLTEGRTLVTRGTAREAAELLILSPGDPRPDVTPLGIGRVSHFPQVHDRQTAWASMSGKEWPDLYLEDPAGRRMLARDALDPVFAGDYLFYESNEASDSPRDRSHYGSIWGIREGEGGKFRLLLTDVSTEGWWQTAMAQGYVDDVLVLANDMTPWNDGTSKYTVVRVYRLRQ